RAGAVAVRTTRPVHERLGRQLADVLSGLTRGPSPGAAGALDRGAAVHHCDRFPEKTLGPVAPTTRPTGRCCVWEAPPMNPRALLDNLEAGVAAIGPDWTIVEWSAAAARMTGLAADRVLGQTFWTAFPLAQTMQIERLLREVLTTGRPRTYILPAGAPDVPGL